MSYYSNPYMMQFASLNRAVGGWKELGRTTLGGANANIDVSSLANKRYLMVLYSLDYTASLIPRRRFNADTGSNYADRASVSGGADATHVNITGVDTNGTLTTPSFAVEHIANYSTNEKLCIMNVMTQGTAGAGTASDRMEIVSKWINTSDPISAVNNYTSTSTFKSGSECVVLGWDAADTHTDNFWEELTSVTASGSSTNLSSGTITAKKYLWVQAYLANTSSHTSALTFNNDSTTYSYRLSDNGGTDSTSTSQSNILCYSATTTPIFVNMFIINISANEKLVIGHTVNQNTAGAGTAPNRREFVGKYDGTSAQITEIDLDSSSGNWSSNSIIKIWGSD